METALSLDRREFEAGKYRNQLIILERLSQYGPAACLKRANSRHGKKKPLTEAAFTSALAVVHEAMRLF